MGRQTQAVDVEQFANDTVRLTSEVKRVTSGVDIVEGEVSGTGKTISVEDPVTGDTIRLDTAEIMSGNAEFRDSMVYELYSREDYQHKQEMNHAPGPQVGENEIADSDTLPKATHKPV